VAAVRAKLRAEAERGCAVLLVSLDLDEVLALADRVLVMFEGRLNGTFERGAFDERELGRRMLGAA
jgi:simple sugar transport system ATP-binding protein